MMQVGNICSASSKALTGRQGQQRLYGRARHLLYGRFVELAKNRPAATCDGPQLVGR
jgi:hypothetical protein